MKKVTLIVLCVALLVGLIIPAVGASNKSEVLRITAKKTDGKIYVTATVKNVTFNALQFRVGYDKSRLTPCDVATGVATTDSRAMTRFEQQEYDSFAAPDGWANYMCMLDATAGAVEYVVSVTPGVLSAGPVNEEGYVSADDSGMALLTMCFQPKAGEKLYSDSITLTGSDFVPTGVVIATDELNEYGVVVGITDGSRVKIDLSGVAEQEKTPGGNDIPVPPLTEPPITTTGGDETGTENNKPDPAKKLSDSITDIKGNWAEKSIRELIDNGVLTGYGDKTFRPGQNLTRAEFAVIMTRGLGLKMTTAPSEFADCSGYAVSYINAVKNAGLMVGVDNKGHFQPNRNITREEVVTVIAKALNLSGGPTLTFADRDQISAWALDGVTAVVGAGIVQGRPNGFAPKDNITRAEIAKIVAEID